MASKTGKVIPKEIIFPIIRMLENSATWTNIYNHTISEKGKRYASNDIGYTLAVSYTHLTLPTILLV